jgi:hypothetical protein
MNDGKPGEKVGREYHLTPHLEPVKYRVSVCEAALRG